MYDDHADLLDVEHVWAIDCYRCANADVSRRTTIEGARFEFERLGWKKDATGYQMCPLCAEAGL